METKNKNELTKLNTKIKKQIGFITKLHLDGHEQKKTEINQVQLKEESNKKQVVDQYEAEIRYLVDAMESM